MTLSRPHSEWSRRDFTPNGIPWEAVREMIQSGVHVREVVKATGATPDAVYARISRGKWRPDQRKLERGANPVAPLPEPPAYTGPLRRRCFSCGLIAIVGEGHFCKAAA